MTHAEAIAKAVKLLRLAQSSNPHEAALAASRAQEIMDRFRLEGLTADVDPAAPPDEPIADFKADLLDAESSVTDTWRCRLASAVARGNECKIYLSSRINERGQKVAGFAIVGRASDAQTVRYLYGWLRREVDRLAETHCAGYGRTYWNNFRIGCVETICQRLAAARTETVQAVRTEAAAGGTLAVMRVERALAVRDRHYAGVEAWMKTNLKLRSGGRRTYRSDPTARQAGRAAGATISIRPARGNLATGQLALRG